MTNHMIRIVTVLTVMAAGAAHAGSNVYLAQGKIFYQGLDFEMCLQRLDEAARRKDNSTTELAEIELYRGLCRYGVGQREPAKKHFTAALQLDPTLELPAGTSPRIRQEFNQVAEQAARLRASDSATSTLKTAADAPKQVTLAPSGKPNADLVAAAPSGKPNRLRIASYALGGTTVAAGAFAAAMGAISKSHERAANSSSTFYVDSLKLGNQARSEALMANVGFAVAGAAAIAAVTLFLTSN